MVAAVSRLVQFLSRLVVGRSYRRVEAEVASTQGWILSVLLKKILS